MKVLLAAAVLLFSFSILISGQASDRSKYINYRYKAVNPEKVLPNGVRHLGGGLIGDYDADPVYGISQVRLGRKKMLWLETSTGQDRTGVTGWRVHDVLSLPVMGRNDYLFFLGDPLVQCQRRGADISNLVGTGRLDRRRGIFRPANLWVANLKTKRFDPVPTAGVKCVYSEP